MGVAFLLHFAVGDTAPETNFDSKRWANIVFS